MPHLNTTDGHVVDTVPDPDDELMRTLDRQQQIRRAGRATHRAIVVLIGDDCSDAEGSGPLVAELLGEEGFIVDAVLAVPASNPEIQQAIQTAVVGGADLVVTIGGTGSGPRDTAPEATAAELDFIIPGIAEALRASGLSANSLDAGLSRGLAGVSGSTVVVNIAGSRSAIRDGMATLGPLVRHVLADMTEGE